MAVEISRERALYGAEATVIVLAMPALFVWPIVILPAIPAIPALVFAIIGVARPRFFAPVGMTDPRRPARRYLHVCAALCCAPAFAVVLTVVDMAAR
ncbi:MAG: hypothetical protein JWM82_1857 [Myxococcales bacterium]|nr:hypothetical protein [Myxococcales bacterium]